MKVVSIFFFLLLGVTINAQITPNKDQAAKIYASEEVSKMSLEEKIGQLFMIRAHSDKGPDHIKEIERQIRKYHVGGLCFFQGTPQKHAQLIQKYQNLSQRPLMIALDAEWGLGMRFKDKDAISFPKNMTLGAIQDNGLVYEMGAEIARQLKRIGINVNFGPVVDVNNNAENPVIHNRSFGEDSYNVATKSYAYMKGLQDNEVLGCAKHFPGHGDTNLDSHYDLPVIKHDMERLEEIELMPFRVLAQLGVGSVMTAHLQVPVIDDRDNRPTSLSSKAIKDILIDDMNFEGLIFTDALEMQGVAKHFSIGESSIEALRAGNDIALMPINMDEAYEAVKKAVNDKVLSIAEIDQKVAKVLKYKYLLGLNEKPIISNISNIPIDINNNSAKALKSKLYQKAITLVKDDEQLVPLKNYNDKRIATLAIGSEKLTIFQKTVDNYIDAVHFNLDKKKITAQKSTLIKELEKYDLVLINIHDMNIYASRDYGLSSEMLNLLYEINSQNKLILTIHGTPYALKYLSVLPSIIVGYEDDPMMQSSVAQAIFGAQDIKGELPVSVQPNFPIKHGIERSSLLRLGHAIPEEVGVSSDTLLLIDSIVNKMIETEAAPGCQIMGIKHGKVFFDKAYGYHTFDKKIPTKSDHIYDVASITKILCTNLALMKLYDEKKLNLLSPIKSYLPELDTCNKGDLIIEDLLAHHAGLPAWIAFYTKTIEKENKEVTLLKDYYREAATDSFSIEVAKNIFLRTDYRDSIFQQLYACELREDRDYRYSDLAFYLFQKLIERVTNMTLDEYVYTHFYKPLNLGSTLFNPYKSQKTYTITPSEDDDYFRNQIVKGYVHDMGAAMLGGVGGHAGLFSNTKDLGIIMQMLLNGGTYGGIRFIKSETLQKFTTRYKRSTRRGLGFDMKELDPEKKLNICEEASPTSFGHLGFTGVSIFADPQNDFVYLFISNRTFPTMNNRKFGKENYRPKVQSVFYRAMKVLN